MDEPREKKKLTIGYLGGSITAGAGASFPEKTSWRALVTRWFRQQNPGAEVTEINAAVGGTGSDLAVFRARLDLLDYQPDIIFVEFTVEDYETPFDRTVRSMEGIVRQARLANPLTQVFFIYTISWVMIRPYLEKGIIPASISAHERVAKHYGIPSLNVGFIFLQAYQNGSFQWDDLTVDDVHPSDEGHRIFAQAVIDFLCAQPAAEELTEAVIQPAEEKQPAAVKPLPAPLCRLPLDHASVIPACRLSAPDWAFRPVHFAGQLNGALSCDRPGAKLVVPFQGSTVGLYWTVSIDSGDIAWSVDGQKEQRASSWDTWALQFTRPQYVILQDNLPEGPHRLTVRVLKERALRSTGNWIRIGGVLAG